ncbi:threonine/serine dehydratase [soil metagenome]
MNPPDTPTFADVQNAADRLSGLTVETPLLRADALDEALGAQVFVKAEALQRTGSFKLRGAYNRLSRLSDAERVAGVVAFSSGNHAQGVAEAARRVGCPAVIVMPSDAPAIKIDATRTLGAQVVFYDRFTQSREAISAALAKERGAVLVPSFDDPFIIAGQGTAGLEAARQLAALGLEADDLICPVSGGGLLAGIARAFGELSPCTRLWSAEPEGFDDHARSLKAGERRANAPGARSVCDALLAPEPGVLTWAVNGSRLSGGLPVSDAEAMAAMRFAFRHLKLVLEPGGAVALAALLAGRLQRRCGVVLVIGSGGNVDPGVFTEALRDEVTA